MMEGMRMRQENWIESRRATPVILEADVVVVGGGPAGVAAAVGATRVGASAVIVDRDGWLGGQAADIFSISPWQFIDEDLNWVVGGITREIFLRTAELGGCDYLWETVPGQIPPPEGAERPFEMIGNGWAAQHKAEGLLHWRDAVVEPQSLRFALHQMCDEAGVRLLLDSTVAGAMMDGNRIAGVLIEFRGQRFGVRGKVVVDATGHGDVAVQAGCHAENYTTLARQGFTRSRGYAGAHSRVCHVNFEETLAYMRERPDQWRLGWGGAPEATADQIAEMVRLGNTVTISGFPELRWEAVQGNPEYRVVGRRPETLETPEGHLVFSYHGDGLVDLWSRSRKMIDLLDPVEFSEIEADIRKVHWLTHRLYRGYIPGFQNSHLLGVVTHVGTASSRRVAVEYTQTKQDLTEGTHYDDVVGRAIGHDWHVVAKYRGFEIPYRALLPEGVDGLLVTGKSAGEFIHCVATVACTGHAAGVAAGLAAKASRTPRELDVTLLQNTLLDQGAVL
jgi:hypothetical protein